MNIWPHSHANPKADDGPACRRLAKHIKDHPRKLPPVLRLSLWLSAACAAGLLATLGLCWIIDPSGFPLLLAFIGLTTVSGPQPATLFVFAQHTPLAVGWVIAWSTLNMAATLFLIVPLAWRSAERVRDVRIIGGPIRSAERFAVQHRAFLARWGALGLVALTWAPVPGAGVLGAGVMGVLLRRSPGRLLVILAVAGAALNLFWTIAIKLVSLAIPTSGIFAYLPYAVIGLFVAAGVWGSWRGHRNRFKLQVQTLEPPSKKRAAQLHDVGVHVKNDILVADLRKVCSKLDIPQRELSRARNVVELLRLDRLIPRQAERLSAAGVVCIHDLAVTPPGLVVEALQETPRHGVSPPVARSAAAWRHQAQSFERRLQTSEGDGAAAAPSP